MMGQSPTAMHDKKIGWRRRCEVCWILSALACDDGLLGRSVPDELPLSTRTVCNSTSLQQAADAAACESPSGEIAEIDFPALLRPRRADTRKSNEACG